MAQGILHRVAPRKPHTNRLAGAYSALFTLSYPVQSRLKAVQESLKYDLPALWSSFISVYSFAFLRLEFNVFPITFCRLLHLCFIAASPLKPIPRTMMDDVFAQGSGLNLRLGIVTLLLAYVIYTYIRRRKEYEGWEFFQFCFRVADLVTGRHCFRPAAWLPANNKTATLRLAIGT